VNALAKTQKIEKYYEALGRFVVDFEYLVEMVREFIIECFKEKGLKEKTLISGILGPLTAGQIISLVVPIFHLCYPGQQEGEEKLQNFVNQLDQLNSVRNNIIHGSHVIEEEKGGVFTIKKQLPARKGKTKGKTIVVKYLEVGSLNKYLAHIDNASSTLHSLRRNLGNERSFVKSLVDRRMQVPKLENITKNPAKNVVTLKKNT